MYVGPQGWTRSLPVGWTNVAAVDSFVKCRKACVGTIRRRTIIEKKAATAPCP